MLIFLLILCVLLKKTGVSLGNITPELTHALHRYFNCVATLKFAIDQVLSLLILKRLIAIKYRLSWYIPMVCGLLNSCALYCKQCFLEIYFLFFFFAKLLDVSLKLEGIYRHVSTHAAGIVMLISQELYHKFF